MLVVDECATRPVGGCKCCMVVDALGLGDIDNKGSRV